jgi:hypothetical protein
MATFGHGQQFFDFAMSVAPPLGKELASVGELKHIKLLFTGSERTSRQENA